MASIEDRFASLAEQHLGISDRAMLDVNTSELGINSMRAVLFVEKVNEEFSASISGEDAAQMSSLRDMINHLEG